MTPAELLAEGRRLERPCVLLRAQGPGTAAGFWYSPDEDGISATGSRCWLSVDATFIPGLDPGISGYVTVYTNETSYRGGRIEITGEYPSRPGIPLHAQPASILPPIDAVLAKGSARVDEWLHANRWSRRTRYNDNFKDRAIVQEYERIYFEEYPLYRGDGVYAALGGWHWPGPDDDWHDLIDDHLMILTVHSSEPWVEAWRFRNGQFGVIQRIT